MHTRQPCRKVRVQSGCDGFMRDPHFVCGGFDDVASMGCSRTGLTKQNGASVSCSNADARDRWQGAQMKRRPL
jgi:hypothetical protein